MCCFLPNKYRIHPDPDNKITFLCGICEKKDSTATKIWRSDLSQRAHRECFKRIQTADAALVRLIRKDVYSTTMRNLTHIASIKRVRDRLMKSTILEYLEKCAIDELDKLFRTNISDPVSPPRRSKSSKAFLK